MYKEGEESHERGETCEREEETYRGEETCRRGAKTCKRGEKTCKEDWATAELALKTVVNDFALGSLSNIGTTGTMNTCQLTMAAGSHCFHKPVIEDPAPHLHL